MRCTPQVIGPVRDFLDFLDGRITAALNAATDNPLIFLHQSEAGQPQAVSGGNFHGQGPAMWLDFLGIALAEVGAIAERRVFRMLTPSLNAGLPAMLVPTSGLDSGLMIPQYTAAALVSDNKTLAHPDSVDSIPSSGNQEDHVSMGANAARHTLEILENVRYILAIELLTSAQAIDLRPDGPDKLGKGTAAAYQVVRSQVATLIHDRELTPDINALADLIQTGRIVQATEAALQKSAARETSHPLAAARQAGSGRPTDGPRQGLLSGLRQRDVRCEARIYPRDKSNLAGGESMKNNLIAIQRVLDPKDNQTGGGAASAAAGAMGAALIGMVARLSVGRKGYEPDAYYEQIDAEAQALAANLLDGARADSDAFDAVMAAYKAPKDTAEEKIHRTRAIQQAMVHATEVPLANAHWNARALALWKKLAGRSNPNAASDLDCALYLAHAGLSGALSNIRINLDQIKDEKIASQITADLQSLEAIADRYAQDALQSRKAA